MLRKILIGVLLLVLAAVGVAAYFWTQATALPEWYHPEEVAVAEEAGAQGPGPMRWTSIPDGEGGEAVELRGFHSQTPLVRGKARKAVKASRAVRTKDKLEAGVIVDTSELKRDELSSKDKATFERALENFPGLTDRDVYIGVEDKPVTKDGVLQLSPSARVRVGNLTYSLSDAAKRLGIPESKLRNDLNKELRKMNAKDPQSG